MIIINKVDNDTLQAFGYEQWVEQFVKEVISKTNLECEEIIIEDIELSERIFMSIESNKYTIRTWNFQPVERDRNSDVCAEMVDYTLFRLVEDDTGSHGEEICNGVLKIEWKN